MARLQGIFPKEISYRLDDSRYAVRCFAVVRATSSRSITDIETLDERHIEDLASVHFPGITAKIRQALLEKSRDKQHITRWTLEVINR